MLSNSLVLRPQMIWPVWPGCAFLVAVLLLTPRKIWPVLLIAGLSGFALYDTQELLPIRATISFLVADSIEILVAALGVRHVFGGVPGLKDVKSLAKYSLFAVILAPVSVASAALLTLEGYSWWLAFFTEALALLTLTPAILSWADLARARVKGSRLQYLEAALMFLGLAIVASLTFMAPMSEDQPALIYLLVPFLLWAALRFGISGTCNSMVLVAFVAIVGVVHRRGPFTGRTPVTDVLSLQLFLLVAATSFMILAAVVEQDKAAEQALREGEERLRLAAQVGRMFAYSWDVDTDVIERSGESAEILGVMNEEVPTGASVASMVHPDDKEVLEGALARLSVENPTVRVIYRIVRPDGVAIWLERNSHAYFNVTGKLKRMVGMVADVTERKRAEEALAAVSRKLIEAQEQERARIGRELHDDINQQLAMLSLELQQVVDDPPLVETRGPELRKKIDGISSDVQALSHELHSSKLEYLGVVAGIKSWCREFAQRQKVEIDFKSEVSRPLPMEIGLTLFRVLQEALHNAVKHSGAKRIQVQIAENSREVLLAISDSGKGFDVEVAMRGTGLGLTSMRERVRLVNGTITIDSEEKRGTSIHLRVPIDSGSSRAAG